MNNFSIVLVSFHRLNRMCYIQWEHFQLISIWLTVDTCTSIYLVAFYILHELTSVHPAQHEAVSNMPSQKALGLPWWLSGKESACNAGDAGDMGSISGLGRSPGGGHGSTLQHSCLENPMDRGACWATVHGVTKSQTQLK